MYDYRVIVRRSTTLFTPSGVLRYFAIARWVALPFGVAIALLALPLACTTVVRAPANESQIVRVFLISEAKTSSLALPQRGGGFVRYAYGDWNWYALRNQSALDGLAALFWPTPGALGRKVIDAAATPDAMRRAIGSDVEVYLLEVDRSAADRLLARLEDAHERGRRAGPVVESYGFIFVPDPQKYTYFNNSNHRTAAWLRELGCDVRGPSFYSRWRVEPSRS
jgi:hypothetical protein